METQTIQARFSDQEQAESAVRKLASLRGDNFRLERESPLTTSASPVPDANRQAGGLYGSVPEQAFDAELASMETPVEAFGWTRNVGEAPAASFSLSAVVPVMAAEQARRVVRDHGGEIV